MRPPLPQHSIACPRGHSRFVDVSIAARIKPFQGASELSLTPLVLRERRWGGLRGRQKADSVFPQMAGQERLMAKITYTIVEHDGGWAYKVGDVFSETFPSHDAAHKAAE